MNRKERILAIITAASFIAIPLYLALYSYYNIDIAASIVFKGNDGWCSIPVESIGVHCFGDWNERVGIDYNDRSINLPWHNNLELSPIGPFLTKIGNIATMLIGPKLTLVAVILLYTLMILSPLIFRVLELQRKNGRSKKDADLYTFLAILSPLTSLPYLSTIDRLNSIAIAVPLLYFFLRYCIQENPKKIIPIIVLLSCIKPQLGLLCIIFLAKG